MTLEQKRSAIKRINERRKEIEKKFGKDSYPARHYREKMDILSGGNLLPSGNISHGNKALDAMPDEDIEAMLKQETAGDIVKKGKKHLERETGRTDITTEDLARFYEQIKPVQEMLEDLGPDMSDALYKWRKENGYLKGSGNGRMSYSQIEEAVSQWNAMTEEEQNPFKQPSYREDARQEMSAVFEGSPQAVIKGSSATNKVQITSGRSGGNMRTSGVSNKA